MKKRAFSLVEITLVTMLLSGMLLFSVMNLGGQKRRASSEALVQVVASELQAARAQAIRDRSPVAVCFPTQGGTLAHSQSLYLMEGLARPRITRVVNYAREFEQAVIAIGCWGSPSITRPSSGENYAATAVQRWLGSGFQDFAFVFTPDGAVTSNDLPLVDGAYHVLVAGQVDASPTSAPPGSGSMTTPPVYFAINKVSAAQTLSITPSGSLSIEPGVTGNGGVTIGTDAFSMSAPAAAPSIPTEIATAPTIRVVEAQPRTTLKPKASVQQGRSLTLKVEASDANGDPLTCSWRSQKLAGGDPGVFSSPVQSPMQWDAQRQVWTLTTTWSPTATAAVGDGYRLTCTVTDPGGLSATRVESALDPVTVTPPSRIVYARIEAMPFMYDVSVIGSDGTGEKNLTTSPTLTDDNPSFSPDGTKIAYTSSEIGCDIFTMNLDGTNKRRLTNTPDTAGYERYPVWSADGTQIFFRRDSFTLGTHCCVMNADGTNWQNLSGGGGYEHEDNIRPSADGRYVVYQAYTSMVSPTGYRYKTSDLIVGEYINDHVNPPRISEPTNVTGNNTPGAYVSAARYSNWFTDGSGRLAYFSYRGSLNAPPLDLNVVRLVDSGPGTVPRFRLTDKKTVLFTYYSPKLSPDGKQIVYTDNSSSVQIADFNPDATPPLIFNPRKLSNVKDPIPGDWFSR